MMMGQNEYLYSWKGWDTAELQDPTELTLLLAIKNKPGEISKSDVSGKLSCWHQADKLEKIKCT